MRKNKKAFIILIVSVIAVLVVGAVTTTYAWFLSRYVRTESFDLSADSSVIIMFETELNFASGGQNDNSLVPATAKQTVGIDQEALSPLDVFDVDVAEPEHTGKVETAAQPVKFTTQGAYWTGELTDTGRFSFSLEAYLNNVAQNARAANGVNDLAGTRRGEIGYYLVIYYLNQIILYYGDNYYILNEQSESQVTAFGNLGLTNAELGLEEGTYYWHTMPTSTQIQIGEEEDTWSFFDGTYLLLKPNTTFDIALYAFVAKTDEELDPAINGQTITLVANLKIEEAAQQQGGNE